MRTSVTRTSGSFVSPLGRVSGLALLVLAASVAGCAGPEEPQSVEALAQRALATIQGELAVPGLEAPVEVIRDEWGVPHIYAENDDDLFFAQGYVMAQDRLWQMEMWRRWHEGRLAEIFGPEALDYDRRTRLMMFRGPFDETEWTSYHPDAHRLFTAHANGVNAYIEENRGNLPLEFQLTGVAPLPWTAETAVLRWAALAVPSVRGHAINEMQLALNVARYGVDEANRRAAPDPWDDLVVPDGLDVSIITQEILDAMRAGDGDPFVTGRLPALEIVEPYRDLVSPPELRAARVLPGVVATEGSNNWVMTGARSPTGVPILANDPHRRIEMPALRYFVHLNAPGWNVIGGGEPPFAGVDAGSNARMAWGFTFAGTDMVDVYVEELHPDEPDLVRWQDGWEPLRIIEEEIPVKGGEPEPIVLKFSRHGPVFYEDLENRRAYAVRSVVQEPGTAAYKGSFQLAQAESCDDFFDRAMHWLVPTHSLICGDADGNIALQVTGLTPDRDGWNGRLPVPGNGAYEWRGFREDLPREFNPERGYIATANNNVHPPGYEGRPRLLPLVARSRDVANRPPAPDPRRRRSALGRRPHADSARCALARGRTGRPRVPGVDLGRPRRRVGPRPDREVGRHTLAGEHRRRPLRAVERRGRPRRAEPRHPGGRAPPLDGRRPERGDRAADPRARSRPHRMAARPGPCQRAAPHAGAGVRPARGRAPRRLRRRQRHRRQLPAHHRPRRSRPVRRQQRPGTVGPARQPLLRQSRRQPRQRPVLSAALHARRGRGAGRPSPDAAAGRALRRAAACTT